MARRPVSLCQRSGLYLLFRLLNPARTLEALGGQLLAWGLHAWDLQAAGLIGALEQLGKESRLERTAVVSGLIYESRSAGFVGPTL